MANRLGTMRFELYDEREIPYNDSIDCTFTLYNDDDDDEILSIEEYRELCVRFAAAMGFHNKTIAEWFGDY